MSQNCRYISGFQGGLGGSVLAQPGIESLK